MTKPIQDPYEAEPSALPFRTGGRLRRNQEYLIFYFFAISSWCLEIAAACLGSLDGAQSHYFIATISPFMATHWMAFLQTCWMMATAPRSTVPHRIAYLNLACRFQRLCAPTALIGMITWAIGYRYRYKASSQAYWIIWLVVWIVDTVVCIMNVYNNISWESDLLYQIAPHYHQGNFWLGVLGIRDICRAKYDPYEKEGIELEEPLNRGV
ncbi:hypothetical protein A1O1_01638 [Capronia coronata CBS 617.96]|uniref:Uncharacterized protein n=1 Tax=Capronia coronata CBS 617.96 TaxID=1182541 RepID=W9YUC7_9EURO|nr:uncharacterized protein A1O1_01638 [Capronia coronata CBS 617.96]EXJ96512.1 hypothetical protein A1O1_01638 [Capronia coronata CBS 617.96]